MTRLLSLTLGLAGAGAAPGGPPDERAAEFVAADRDRQALLAFLQTRGVDLRPAADRPTGVMHQFTVGPDHGKKLVVGLTYMPSPKLICCALPSVTHGRWVVWQVGGSGGGNTAADHLAAWQRVADAVKEYAARADPPAADPWPVLVAGKPREKTFRFRPAGVEYHPIPVRAAGVFLVVVRIDDPAVPADSFAFELPTRVGGVGDKVVKERFEKLLAVGDGHLTVKAIWVNMPVDGRWLYGDKSRVAGALAGRLLIGTLQTPPRKD